MGEDDNRIRRIPTRLVLVIVIDVRPFDVFVTSFVRYRIEVRIEEGGWMSSWRW